MKSMTVGLRDDLHPEQFEQFAKIGMTHILAISGLHVGVFLSAVTVIFMLVGVRRDLRLTLCIWIIPFYIVFTGAAPSVLRAGMMAMAGLYALKRKRLKDGLGIVSGTGVILLAWNPYF